MPSPKSKQRQSKTQAQTDAGQLDHWTAMAGEAVAGRPQKFLEEADAAADIARTLAQEACDEGDARMAVVARILADSIAWLALLAFAIGEAYLMARQRPSRDSLRKCWYKDEETESWFQCYFHGIAQGTASLDRDGCIGPLAVIEDSAGRLLSAPFDRVRFSAKQPV